MDISIATKQTQRTANGMLGHFPIYISYQNTVAYDNTG